MTHTRMCQECPVSLEKLSFFFIQVKIIQVLVFDNWHPLKLVNLPSHFACINMTMIDCSIVHVVYNEFHETNKNIY